MLNFFKFVCYKNYLRTAIGIFDIKNNFLSFRYDKKAINLFELSNNDAKYMNMLSFSVNLN
jgi:hypothetical protein